MHESVPQRDGSTAPRPSLDLVPTRGIVHAGLTDPVGKVIAVGCWTGSVVPRPHVPIRVRLRSKKISANESSSRLLKISKFSDHALSGHGFQPRLPTTPSGHAFRPRLPATSSDMLVEARLNCRVQISRDEVRLNAFP